MKKKLRDPICTIENKGNQIAHGIYMREKN